MAMLTAFKASTKPYNHGGWPRQSEMEGERYRKKKKNKRKKKEKKKKRKQQKKIK
jgi:hypothetical protein